MPPESLWIQYSIIGILVLAAGIIAAAFYRLWRELLTWIEQQDTKRQAERDKQREWEGEQNQIRDAGWQAFINAQQERWREQDCEDTKVLSELVKTIEELKITVNNHDIWARAQDRKI